MPVYGRLSGLISSEAGHGDRKNPRGLETNENFCSSNLNQVNTLCRYDIMDILTLTL